MEDKGPLFSTDRNIIPSKRRIEETSGIETLNMTSIQVTQNVQSNQAAANKIRDRLKKLSKTEKSADVSDAMQSSVEKDTEITAEYRELPVGVVIEAKIQLKERVKEKSEKQLSTYRDGVQDNVRLWEKGWKERYYSDKCKVIEYF